MTEILLGFPITKASDATKRFSGLFWGDAGVGKTTLAATLPGRKLMYEFDFDGASSIAHAPDLDILDLSEAPSSVTEQFKNPTNPVGILSVIDEYDSFIFDSVTNITDKTLMRGVSTEKGATVERPSPAAYGVRNALAIRLIKNVMVITRRANKNVVFIAHEGAPERDKEGHIIHISMALGGQLPSNIGIDFSEIWHMYQVDSTSERRIMVTPARLRKPAKTRMFIQTSEDREFVWKFDPDKWDDPKNIPYRIDTWMDMWRTNNAKLPLPGTKEFIKLQSHM